MQEQRATTPEPLQGLFEYLRKTYFAEWRDYAEWRILFKKMPAARLGDHSKAGRTIEINPNQDEDQIAATIIHEICHVLAGSHEQQERWIAWMERAAEGAERLAQTKLARA